jgi:hypothetical protein
MTTRIKLLLSLMSLCCGLILSGVVLHTFGLWQTQSGLVWSLERPKAGQISFWGQYPRSFFGGSMAVGDVNGDGIDDLIASASNTTEITRSGLEVYVIPGPIAFNEVYTMPEKAALVFQGPENQQQVAAYLDSGDMNGDGIDDIVIGSWASDRESVYLGSVDIQSSSPMTIAKTPENMALTLVGAGEGLALCDLNADGYEDLFTEKFSIDGSVQVWGILGRSSLSMTNPLTLSLPTDADILINGINATKWRSANYQNMACGDIDGDGYPDLVIGIYGESPDSRPDAGVVYVIRGDPEISGESLVTISMPDQAGAIIEGVSSGDELGSSLAIADVNQDGRGDLIMAARLASRPDDLIQYAGEVYLWMGQELSGQRFTVSSQTRWIVYGEKAFDLLGESIATGDFDQDGYPEILLGCSQCSQGEPPLYLPGRGYVLEPLQFTGPVTVTAVSQLEILPYEGAQCLGISTEAMDLDQDGFDDLVISAPCTDYPEDSLPGTVYALSYPIHFKFSLPLINR